MARLTETNMSAAERTAFLRLMHAVGFAPKVMYGRDRSSTNHLIARLTTNGESVLYALAINGQPRNDDVQEYRLLIAPVAEPTTTHTMPKRAHRVSKQNGHDKAWAERVASGVKRSWAARREKFGPAGRRWFRKPADVTAAEASAK